MFLNPRGYEFPSTLEFSMHIFHIIKGGMGKEGSADNQHHAIANKFISDIEFSEQMNRNS